MQDSSVTQKIFGLQNQLRHFCKGGTLSFWAR